MERTYTDAELLDRVSKLQYFTHMPDELLVVVRSKADVFDRFDDKAYLYSDGKFIAMATCTTNPGSMSLLGGFKKRKVAGAAIIQSGKIYYDVYEFGYHKGRMPALKQVREMDYYRDGDCDQRSEEIGKPYRGNFATNYHFCSYESEEIVVKQQHRTYIGPWGEGCIVANAGKAYYVQINHVHKKKKPVSLAVILED